MPAEAGIHSFLSLIGHREKDWIPACAGMTEGKPFSIFLRRQHLVL